MSNTNILLKLSDNFDAWRDKLNSQANYIDTIFNIISPLIPSEKCTDITDDGFFVAIDTTSQDEKYIKATNPKTIIGVRCGDAYIKKELDVNTNTEVPKSYFLISSTGIVNAKIIGKINKGDEIVLSTTKGVGRKYTSGDNEKNIIGFALETNQSEGIKLVKIKI